MTNRPESRSSGLSERIRQTLPDFSPAERRVARVLLSAPPAAGLGSSARLAELAEVSGPTVSRFASRLGFASYGQFQTALRADVSARVMSPIEVYHQQLSQYDEEPLSGEAAQVGRAVERSIYDLPAKDLETATAYLADTRRHVFAVGGWFSHLVAAYFTAILREFRPGARLVQPIASERVAAITDIRRRDVVVVFDYRRYELDSQEFAQAAQAAGARVILFTDPWLSPLADTADAIFPAEVTGPAPFESLTPTLAVTETLLTAVIRALGASGTRRLEQFGGFTDRWLHPWVPTDNDERPHSE